VQRYIGALTIALLLRMVWVRVLLIRRHGIKPVKFGSIDKKNPDSTVRSFLFLYRLCGGI
jgi:hypothetical protein